MPVPFDAGTVVPIIAELLAQRHALRYIAGALALRGVLTPRGKTRWEPQQVKNLIATYGIKPAMNNATRAEVPQDRTSRSLLTSTVPSTQQASIVKPSDYPHVR